LENFKSRSIRTIDIQLHLRLANYLAAAGGLLVALVEGHGFGQLWLQRRLDGQCLCVLAQYNTRRRYRGNMFACERKCACVCLCACVRLHLCVRVRGFARFNTTHGDDTELKVYECVCVRVCARVRVCVCMCVRLFLLAQFNTRQLYRCNVCIGVYV